MRMTQETEVLKGENLLPLFEELTGQVLQAAQGGTPIHEVENVVWQQVLRIGRAALGQFLALLGTGDMGETITLPDGRCCRRLDFSRTRFRAELRRQRLARNRPRAHRGSTAAGDTRAHESRARCEGKQAVDIHRDRHRPVGSGDGRGRRTLHPGAHA